MDTAQEMGTDDAGISLGHTESLERKIARQSGSPVSITRRKWTNAVQTEWGPDIPPIIPRLLPTQFELDQLNSLADKYHISQLAEWLVFQSANEAIDDKAKMLFNSVCTDMDRYSCTSSEFVDYKKENAKLLLRGTHDWVPVTMDTQAHVSYASYIPIDVTEQAELQAALIEWHSEAARQLKQIVTAAYAKKMERMKAELTLSIWEHCENNVLLERYRARCEEIFAISSDEVVCENDFVPSNFAVIVYNELGIPHLISFANAIIFLAVIKVESNRGKHWYPDDNVFRAPTRQTGAIQFGPEPQLLQGTLKASALYGIASLGTFGEDVIAAPQIPISTRQTPEQIRNAFFQGNIKAGEPQAPPKGACFQFFSAGQCSRGYQCPYKHHSPPAAEEGTVHICSKYFRDSSCFFKTCQLLHVNVEELSSQSPSKRLRSGKRTTRDNSEQGNGVSPGK
jgi:hypothetical protein